MLNEQKQPLNKRGCRSAGLPCSSRESSVLVLRLHNIRHDDKKNTNVHDISKNTSYSENLRFSRPREPEATPKSRPLAILVLSALPRVPIIAFGAAGQKALPSRRHGLGVLDFRLYGYRLRLTV